MIYHLNIVLIYIFCTLSLCRGRDGWRSQCQFRENLRTPPSHDNFPNKPKNKNTELQNPALSRQFPKQTEKQKYKSCKRLKTPSSHDNVPQTEKQKYKSCKRCKTPPSQKISQTNQKIRIQKLQKLSLTSNCLSG